MYCGERIEIIAGVDEAQNSVRRRFLADLRSK